MFLDKDLILSFLISILNRYSVKCVGASFYVLQITVVHGLAARLKCLQNAPLQHFLLLEG